MIMDLATIVDVGETVLAVGTGLVTAASALDRGTKRMDISNETRRASAVLNFLKKLISFLAMNNFGAVGRK